MYGRPSKQRSEHSRDRTRTMDETSAQPEEHMILRYRKVDRNLFGYIAFLRMEHPDREEVKWSGKFRQDAKVVSMRWETCDGTPQIHGRVQAQGGYSGHAWGRNGTGHSRSAWHQCESTEQVE